MAYSEDVNINMNLMAGAMGGVTAIMGGMSALTSTFSQFGTEAADTFGTLDGLLVGTTALIVSFGVKAAEAYGEFEQGMKIVQTVSNQSGAAINELTNKANEMSVAYRTSIGDITEGLQTLGRAGLNSATTQLEVLESGLQTAKLEGRNLNGVLEEIIQNTAMLGGDLKSVDFGKQSEYLNSLMVGTSMTAPINSHDISQTLQYAGGTAAAAGINLENKDKLEDFMGTIAAFAQKGVSGSMAGTALRAFFTKPASQDASVTEGLSMIGLSPEALWEDGGKSMKKVSDQIAIIRGQMNALHLSTMDQVEIWGKIVGPKMGQQMMKLQAGDIKELTKDIQSSQSAEALAAQTLQTYNQKVSEMQQQGERAFRELGSKAVMFLTPIVDVIGRVLGLLSNKWVNTGVFAALGAIVAHGVRKIWGMITSVFSQFKGLLAQTVQGIQQINGISGGSAPGFQQSASSVEMLNARLAQTNAELAQMQAQFMGIRGMSATGTYSVPYGLADKNGKLPANMISTTKQRVLWNPGDEYNHAKIYDQSETERFKSDYKKQMQGHIDRQVNAAVAGHYDESIGRSGGYRDDKTGRIISKDALVARYQDQYGMSSKEMEKHASQALENAKKEVHASTMSMTEQEYKKFKQGLDDAESRFNDPNQKAYWDKAKNGKKIFNQKLYDEDALKTYNNRVINELERNSPDLTKRTVNGQTFRRTIMLNQQRSRFFGTDLLLQKEGQFRQYEDARAPKQKTSMNKRAQDVHNRQMSMIGRGAETAGRGLRRLGKELVNTPNHVRTFGNSVRNTGSSLSASFRRIVMGLNAVSPQIQSTINGIMATAKTSFVSFEEAVMHVAEMSNLTAEEFIRLIETTPALQQKFQELYVAMTEDEEATIAETRARIQDTIKANEEALAREGNILQSATSKLGSAISTVSGYMGGPFMAGMMAVTVAMQVIQEVQQKWQEKMQEATNQMSESKDKASSAEEEIRSFYKSQDESLTDADLDKAVDERYAALYDATSSNDIDRTKLGHRDFEKNVDMRSITDEETGEKREMTPEEMIAAGEAAETVSLASDENVRALEENTMALNSATQAYAQGLQKASNAFDDGVSGFNGIFTDVSDGGMGLFKGSSDWEKQLNEAYRGVNKAIESLYTESKGFFDSDSPVLTDSQADKNYPGSTEFGAILSADTYRFGVEGGLRQFFGNDYDQIIGLMNSMDNKIGTGINSKEALFGLAGMFTSMPSDKFSTAQMYMKDNPETLSRFGKQMFRYEKENPGQSAIMDWRTGKKIPQNNNMIAMGSNRMQKKDLQQILNKGKYTVNDKNFERTFKRIMHETGGKLTYANILAMGSLQQLQDMFKVTNETVAPGVMQTMQGVYQNVSATGMAASNAGDAAGGAGTAGANAAIIASILARKFQIEAEGMVYEGTYLHDPNAPTNNGQAYSKEEFMRKMADMNDHSMDKYRDETLQTIAGTGTSLGHPGASQDYIDNRAYEQSRKLLQENPLTGHLEAAPGVSNNWQHMLNTASQPIKSYFEGASQAAYNSSNIGEYGSGGTGGSSGGGGGGDGGGGSGDSGSSEGTKKSRVDLVLCNKKEIPKLNVNLFKTPPNFTILNKNFKLRDIKINSQDKPKAIMAAVKNGIIETQKRMDPKIIQDESGEYDPLAATEGKATPSGNTPTSSSSSNSN